MTDDIIKDATAIRKHLHQYPEVSSYERETSHYLTEQLRQCEPDELIVFDNWGIAAVFEGIKPGKRILFRADFDALPIEEVNDFAHKSLYPGVSHKCGHDGHAAILYTLARLLANNRPEKGDAILLFQPAEENGEGAKGIINDPEFARIQPDFAVALHNLPGFPLHAVVWKEGAFTAAANSMIIQLTGKTSHAAEPELGINPAQAMAEITQAIIALNHADIQDQNFRIATPVYTTMGEKSYGVSAGYGELHFTLRAWHNAVIRDFEKACEQIATQIGQKHGLDVQVEWIQKFFANHNEARVTKAIRRVARSNGLKLIQREYPFKWGEDFGIFTEEFPGAMFGIGAGQNSPALHNPDYDFPDSLIKTGSDIFYKLIEELQKN